MNLSLTDRRAIVCGSTQGIGHACAVELALLGASVTLLARDPERLKVAAAALPTPAEKTGQSHDFVVADFSRVEEVEEAARQAIRPDTGGRPCHILINNTGGPPGGPIAEADPEAFRKALDAHLINNHILVRACLPGMKAADRGGEGPPGYGRIINILSTSVKAPIPGLGVSNTVRAAVASWAKTLAGELARFNITVNNILPGFTDTARLQSLFEARAKKENKTVEQVTAAAIATIPMARLGLAEEIAAAAAFLATPAAAYITGINLPVDGGRTQSL